jgi:hypothetical protein
MGRELAGADSTEKYFWWCRITVVRTFGGQFQEGRVEVAADGGGIFGE